MFCAFIVLSITLAGCISCGAGGTGESSQQTGTPSSHSPTGLPSQSASSPTPVPDPYYPGSNGVGYPVNTAVPTMAPGTNGTPTPVPGPTPVPVVSATTSEWGSDKDTYSRGSTATGWVYVTNTGNVPIDQIDFTIVVKRTYFFIPVSKTFTYNANGLNIQPGVKQQVAFSISIPSDFEGVSTAGDYKLTATAYLAGNEIGSFSKNIKVV